MQSVESEGYGRQVAERGLPIFVTTCLVSNNTGCPNSKDRAAMPHLYIDDIEPCVNVPFTTKRQTTTQSMPLMVFTCVHPKARMDDTFL